MFITKAQLINFRACKGGLARFIEQTNDTDGPVNVETLFNGKNTISDLSWLALKTIPLDRLLELSKDCALVNLELIKPYTDQYELISDFLSGNAADAAYAAARAADAADAADAASRAADAVAVAVAYAGNQEKIIKLMIDMFNEFE